MLMDFKDEDIVELKKLNKLNNQLAEECFIKDMQQVSNYEEYITSPDVDLTVMLKAYEMELGRAC